MLTASSSDSSSTSWSWPTSYSSVADTCMLVSCPENVHAFQDHHRTNTKMDNLHQALEMTHFMQQDCSSVTKFTNMYEVILSCMVTSKGRYLPLPPRHFLQRWHHHRLPVLLPLDPLAPLAPGTGPSHPPVVQKSVQQPTVYYYTIILLYYTIILLYCMHSQIYWQWEWQVLYRFINTPIITLAKTERTRTCCGVSWHPACPKSVVEVVTDIPCPRSLCKKGANNWLVVSLYSPDENQHF